MPTEPHYDRQDAAQGIKSSAPREQAQQEHRLAALLKQARRARRDGEFTRCRAILAESDRVAAAIGRMSIARAEMTSS
jgi:hypothetical protein